MKKFLYVFCALIFVSSSSPVFSQDDDSTPYMPYPEQPAQNVQSQKRSVRKVTTKKPAPKKKATTRKAAAPAPKPAPRPSSLQQGIELLRQEKYDAAKSYLLKAIQENRNDPNVWYWYGVYNERTGGYYQAQYFYSKAVTIDPAFEPLSRVVFYPEDSEKTALWDPKRPARVYPVETSGGGITAIPPNSSGRSSFPTAPNDPELPKVPVYVPPEPGAIPTDGDSWSPSVYVPPSRDGLDSQNVISNTGQVYRQIIEIPITASRPENTVANSENASSIRADKPLYNPPEPGQRIASTPAKTASAPQKATAAKQTSSTARKQPVSARRVVRKSNTPARPQQNTQPQRRTVSPDVRPQNVQPVRPAQPAQPAQPVQQETRPQPEIRQPEIRQQYLPPVGQYAPDPGTISETPIPPVGQGSQD